MFCLEVLIYIRLQMCRHNDIIGRNEYLISTWSDIPFLGYIHAFFLFKSTHHSWRYERKCEWVFFLNTVYTRIIIIIIIITRSNERGASARRYRNTLQSQNITCVVNVKKFWRTEKSSSQCRMMRRLSLLWRSVPRPDDCHPVSHDVSPGKLTLTMRATAGVTRCKLSVR